MQQRLLIVIEDGAFKGAALTTDSGSPLPLDTLAELGAVILPFNDATLVEIERLTKTHAVQIEQLTAAHFAEIQNYCAAHAVEIEQLRKELTAPVEHLADNSPRAIARVALREQWDSLPAWIRGPYQHQFAAANALLDAGQDDAAAALIQYADVPTAFDLEQIEVFSRVRAEMLAALEALPA
jgi:hypothetical protein